MPTMILTREGYNKLKEEFNYLWTKLRPEVTEKVSWAASLGDRSENADYQYNKRYLRQIDGRIQHLAMVFDKSKVVDYNPQQDGTIYFGAYVELENEAGEIKTVRIVGSEEIYGRTDYISVDCPLARALLKHQVDDEVKVHAPQGIITWFVTKISYQKEDWYKENITNNDLTRL
ncbi:MAG: transcription elongation factor GreB [Succinivibrionaceae bacterium]|nr:transcription elongation factor GreB [Succinivibrionaceae bacterium]